LWRTEREVKQIYELTKRRLISL